MSDRWMVDGIEIDPKPIDRVAKSFNSYERARLCAAIEASSKAARSKVIYRANHADVLAFETIDGFAIGMLLQAYRSIILYVSTTVLPDGVDIPSLSVTYNPKTGEARVHVASADISSYLQSGIRGYSKAYGDPNSRESDAGGELAQGISFNLGPVDFAYSFNAMDYAAASTVIACAVPTSQLERAEHQACGRRPALSLNGRGGQAEPDALAVACDLALVLSVPPTGRGGARASAAGPDECFAHVYGHWDGHPAPRSSATSGGRALSFVADLYDGRECAGSAELHVPSGC